MWKCITRGLRAPFERGPWANLPSTSANDQSRGNGVSKENTLQLPCVFRFMPCFLESLQRHFRIPNNCKDDKDEEYEKSSDKTSAGESFHSENVNVPPCAFLEAVGWSSVLVLGWTILQPWYKHENRQKRCIKSKVNPDPDVVKRYSSLYRLLVHPAFSQPVNNHILPSRLPVINKDKQFISQELSAPLSTTLLTQTSSESDTKTIEEAFDEAADELKRVHELAVGEAENRLGVSCLTHQRNDEAVEHFKNALALNYAPAAFNLGHCYELGIGMVQDYTQAAHFYKIASDMGHPMAAYNLGVFYAHGWGGLAADSEKAKSMFLIAAARGQSEAVDALNLKHKSKPVKGKPRNQISHDFESRLADHFYKMANVSLHFTKENTKVQDNYKEFNNVSSNYVRPRSSLPSSSATESSSQLSSSPSTSLEDHSLLFHQTHSTTKESTEDFSDVNSEDEWQASADFSFTNSNSSTFYNLAVFNERKPTADPEQILQLYRTAAYHGNQKAKQYLKVLEEHYTLGTLNEFVENNKRKSRLSSVSNSSFHK